LTYAYANTGANGNLNSTNIFHLATHDSTSIVSQTNAQSTISPTYGLTLTYTEPLGGRKYLEFDYNITSDINKVSKDVYDWQNEQPTFNNKLSNAYNSNYLYSRPGINFRINRDRYNFTVGTAFQQTMLDGKLLLTNQSINRTFQAVLPVLHFNYDFAMGKRLRVDYTTSMQEPTISQLQPIINNSDQLNLSTGNPQLQPAYANQLRMNFNSFSPEKFFSVFALVNANYTTNTIVNSQTTDQFGVRLTKPVNVGSGSSLSGNFSVGIPLAAIKSRVNIGPNYSVSRSINLINTEENKMIQQTIGGLVRYNFSLNEILIVDLSANLSKQETSYSFNSQQNQSFFNQTYSSEVNVNFLKNYAFNTELNYFDYRSATTNFHQTIPLWNVGLSRYMLKNRSGELKLAVINLLDRSLSVTQTASTNYLQQQTTNNLGRYLMVSFTYILNKQLNPMNGARQRGGGNRMFRQPGFN
jgi:outer membrane receptor protein involved in Fe transport